MRLALLGPPLVWVGGQSVSFPTRKTLGLLVYLAVTQTPHSREKLQTLFWPESDTRRGRGALRTTLLYLRRALAAVDGERYLHSQQDSVAINHRLSLTLDTAQLAAAAKSAGQSKDAASLLDLVAQYRGPFLDGYSLPDAPAFDEWARWQQQHIHQQWHIVFDHLSEQQLQQRQWTAATDTCMRWVAHDALHEPASRRLIEAHLLTGRRVDARKTFEQFRNLLKNEVGADPSTALLAIERRIDAPKAWLTNDTDTPEQAASPLSFVGRGKEYAHLVEIWRRVEHGRMETAIIEGEPGIGKTALAEQFLRWASLQESTVLSGRAFAAGGHYPYQPVTMALRQRLEKENAPEDLLSDVWLTELSRLLPEIRERYPDLAAPEMGDPLGQSRLLEAVIRLVQAFTARPSASASHTAVLFIDDIQWADSATLDLLQYGCRAWAEHHVPVLLLVTARSEAVTADDAFAHWLTQLARAVPVSQIQLSTLTADESAELVEQWAAEHGGSELLTDDMFNWLYRETAGHPFYLTETLKMRRDTKVTSITKIPTVRYLILSRLRQLSPQARELATAVSVWGRPCRFVPMCRIADVGETSALEALDTLLARGLLLRTTRNRYALSHDKIRDVLYTEAGEARRRLFHQRALHLLEAVSAPSADLAHHARAAWLPALAVRYSLAAGDDALGLFASRDAIAQYEAARQLLKNETSDDSWLSPDERTRLFLELSRAYELAGDLRAGERIANELQAWGEEMANQSAIWAALNRQANLAIYTQRLEAAAATLQKARSVAEQHDNPLWLAETEWNMAQLAHHRYDMLASKAHSQRTISLARSLDNRLLAAGGLNNLGYAHLLLGELDDAVAVMQEAEAQFRNLGNRAAAADCLTATAGAQIFGCRSSDAIPMLENALTEYREIENPWGILFCCGWLAAGLLDLGEPERALRLNEEAAVFARDLGTTPVAVWNRLWVGNAYRALNEISAAVAAHREATSLNSRAPLPSFSWYCAAELCADYAFTGEWEKALWHAHAALQHAVDTAIPQIVLPQQTITAVLLKGDSVQIAHENLERCAVLWNRVPRFRIAHRLALSELSSWCNDTAAADAHLRAAEKLTRSFGLVGVARELQTPLLD